MARPVAYVEAEAFASAVLLSRMEEGLLAPGPVWTDVTTFDGRPFRGLVDLVLGGSPCQDLSVAGKREGLDGTRSGLFWHFVRIVEECQPALVFWENVGGAVSSLPRIFDAFAAVGYRGAAVAVRASDVGAPHRRQRIFLLAYRDGDGLEVLRGCGLLDGQREALGDDAVGCGEAVADTDNFARDEGRAERGGRHQGGGADPRAGPRGEGGSVADAGNSGLQGSERPGASGEDARAPRPTSECRRALWPPGPGDIDGWRDYLAAGGPPPAVGRFRRGVDGMAGGTLDSVWADRLRLLGNGVVPAQAAEAFRFLAQRLGGG